MPKLTYLAQRYGSWEWLSTDLELQTDGPEWVLSSYGIMSGTISPETGLLKARDGRPILEEWGTLIHAESGTGSSRSRHWTGIVVRSELTGSDWVVQVREWPGYLNGLPFEGMLRGVKADPADLLRSLWGEVQSWPNAWLGVSVIGSTQVRVGSDSDDRLAAARATMDARKRTLDQLSKSKTTATSALQDLASTLSDEVAEMRKLVTQAQQNLAVLTAAGAPAAQIEAARILLTSRQQALSSLVAAYNTEIAAGKSALRSAKSTQAQARAAYDQARAAYDAARERAREDGGAYELRGDSLTDSHRAAVDLCRQAGIEWRTRTVVSDFEPRLELLVSTQIGADRRDLVFEQGVNIMKPLKLERDGDDYANAGTGIGAGEGPKAIRHSINEPSPRLRRPCVLEDKSLTTTARLDAALRAELRRRAADPHVQQIEVVDHPQTPMFSWSVGDQITIRGRVPFLGDYEEKHRILSWQMKGPERALIDVQPSFTL